MVMRARLNKDGLAVTLAGYGVPTAPLDKFVIHPEFATSRIYVRGTANLGALIPEGTWPRESTVPDWRMVTINLGKTFAHPPQCFVTGNYSNLSTRIQIFGAAVIYASPSGTSIAPKQFFTVSTTQLKVYVSYYTNADGQQGGQDTFINSVNYIVMENMVQ